MRCSSRCRTSGGCTRLAFMLRSAPMELTLPLLQEKLREWDGCPLSKSANAVLGEGNSHADVMFIGEAPGQKEDELKRPFVGAAGQFLDELIESMGWKREHVYISNVVKYRPPG